jgi:hypothetical protein
MSKMFDEIFIREDFPRAAERPMLKKGDVLYSCPIETQNDPKFRVEIAFGESEIVQGEPLLPTLLNYAQFTEETLNPFGAILTG